MATQEETSGRGRRRRRDEEYVPGKTSKAKALRIMEPKAAEPLIQLMPKAAADDAMEPKAAVPLIQLMPEAAADDAIKATGPPPPLIKVQPPWMPRPQHFRPVVVVVVF